MNNMSCHRTSSTMNGHSKSSKRQFVLIVFFLVMWTMMLTGAAARPSLDSMLTKQNDVRQLFLDELLANANGENLFHELKKYHHQQPNYLAKWPGLRDLVLTNDYDDDLTSGPAENSEILNYKLLERLRQLTPSNYGAGDIFQDVRADNEEDSISIPLKSSKVTANLNTFKEHNTKKNVQFRQQYMSPCHFKICNMGRKRDARMFNSNY